MDKQSVYLQKLPILVEPRADDANNPFQAVPEFRLLAEAKDIVDELQVIKDINKQQSSTLRSLAENSYKRDTFQEKRKTFFLEKRPAAIAETVDDLLEKADKAYKAILHLLDLKQKQANIFEARSATKMVRESEKSGETMMLVRVLRFCGALHLLTETNSSPLSLYFSLVNLSFLNTAECAANLPT